MTKPNLLQILFLLSMFSLAAQGIAMAQEKPIGPCAGYSMPIIQPREGIDFKMTVINPLASIDYKMIVIDPCPDFEKVFVYSIPSPLLPNPNEAGGRPRFNFLPNSAAPSIKSPSEMLKQFAWPRNKGK